MPTQLQFIFSQDGKSVGFLWSQGGDQFELEEAQGEASEDFQ